MGGCVYDSLSTPVIRSLSGCLDERRCNYLGKIDWIGKYSNRQVNERLPDSLDEHSSHFWIEAGAWDRPLGTLNISLTAISPIHVQTVFAK